MFSPTQDTKTLVHEFVPNSADDLLQADALIRAHGMRFQSSISLTCKELRLAPEVLFSIPLWQPLTILRTYFTGLHIHLAYNESRGLIRRPGHFRRERKNSLASLPTSN